jgi:hypothetical protein
LEGLKDAPGRGRKAKYTAEDEAMSGSEAVRSIAVDMRSSSSEFDTLNA